MKKLLKILGILILILILIVLGFYLFINSKGIPSYPTAELEYTATTDSMGLERGRILVSTLCAGCHMNNETRKLTGKRMHDAPAEFGIVNSPNITQDKEYGIGSWTDAEILYLLRTGIKRDGKYAPPYMAKLPKMADKDIASIIAFLRSDNPMVAADPTPDKPCEPSFLTKMLCNMAFKPFPMPEAEIPMPDTSNALELGKYTAFNLECFSCHSENFKTNDYLNPENSKGFMGGGNPMPNLEGNVLLTANLTPHKETGIGNWSREQFVNAVKYGTMVDEDPLQYPMMPYNLMSDKEISAIYDYLMSIPAIENKVERKIYN